VETATRGAALAHRPREPAPEQVNMLGTTPLRPIDPDPVELEQRLRFLDAVAARMASPETGKKTARSRATNKSKGRSKTRRRR
jgi:hypothetical protein